MTSKNIIRTSKFCLNVRMSIYDKLVLFKDNQILCSKHKLETCVNCCVDFAILNELILQTNMPSLPQINITIKKYYKKPKKLNKKSKNTLVKSHLFEPY